MEQDRVGRDVVAAGVWGEAKAEVEWAARSPQAREEVVYAQTAAIKSRILSDNRVIRRLAPSVARQ